MSENTENTEDLTPQAEVSTEASDAPQTMSGETMTETEPPAADAQTDASQPVEGEVEDAPVADEAPTDVDGDGRISELEALVAERTSDLQRLQAEYVNYKRRVDRDRALSKQAGIETVVQDLIPIYDSIDLARQHDDISEGGQMVVDALGKLGEKYGLTSFGAVGEVFDPTLHDALMQAPMPDGAEVSETTISQVMQTGYKLGDRVLRPARVGVANPA